MPIVAVPAFGALGAMMFAVAAGAFPVNFALSGIPFKLHASQITATQFVQYAQPDHVTNPHAGDLIARDEATEGIPRPGVPAGHVGDQTYVADSITTMHNPRIYDMRQTVCAPIPILGDWLGNLQVTITAGDHGSPVSADNMLVNSPAMKADSATFWNIQIGADAMQALSAWDYTHVFGDNLGPGAMTGNFAQAAQAVQIDNVHQVGTGTTADRFTLPNLAMSAAFVGSCP